MPNRVLRWLSNLDAHHRLMTAAAFAAVAFLAAMGRVSFAAQLIITWDAYAVCVLVTAWAQIFTARPRELIRLATLQHSSRTLIFSFVLTAACASLGAVAYLLSTAKGLARQPLASHVIAAVATVILSWMVVHTIFTLHYAYLYYIHPHPECKGGGLQFPDGAQLEPDYRDFAYFSFVIGMTSQVSDVQISSPGFRHWALIHGLISFGFNAAILALSINIISGMI